MRAEYALLLLALLAVLCAVLAVWLPADAAAGVACPWWWLYLPQLRALADGGDPVDPPISEQHSPHFWLYLPKVAGVGL